VHDSDALTTKSHQKFSLNALARDTELFNHFLLQALCPCLQICGTGSKHTCTTYIYLHVELNDEKLLELNKDSYWIGVPCVGPQALQKSTTSSI